ncbi:hypothetical protein [Hydrogenophaga sp.]|uniref:hypothetical protein n=1 Tax=Hydrogenophaga sp. TaxID=1904254 RepID=UPI003D0FD35B
MIKLFPQAAALTCLLASTAQAEPSRVPNWLMNEPMSLFDWGMYKTDQHMRERLKAVDVTFSAKYFHASAQYDWKENRIKLNAMFTGDASAVTDAACIEHIKKAKGAFLNYAWEAKEQIQAAPEVMATLFSHEGGYQSKGQPKDVGEQLANITVLEVTMMRASGSGFAPQSRCSSSLTSTSVNVIKN